MGKSAELFLEMKAREQEGYVQMIRWHKDIELPQPHEHILCKIISKEGGLVYVVTMFAECQLQGERIAYNGLPIVKWCRVSDIEYFGK